MRRGSVAEHVPEVPVARTKKQLLLEEGAVEWGSSLDDGVRELGGEGRLPRIRIVFGRGAEERPSSKRRLGF